MLRLIKALHFKTLASFLHLILLSALSGQRCLSSVLRFPDSHSVLTHNMLYSHAQTQC